jgi:hypothetical protein
MTNLQQFDYIQFFSQLPDDMKKYHILPQLDCISQMCLRNVLLGVPLPEVSGKESTIMVSHGLHMIKHFWNKGKVDAYILAVDLFRTEESHHSDALVRWSLDQEIKIEGLTNLWSHLVPLAIIYCHPSVMALLLDRDIELDPNVFSEAYKEGRKDILLLLKESKYYTMHVDYEGKWIYDESNSPELAPDMLYPYKSNHRPAHDVWNLPQAQDEPDLRPWLNSVGWSRSPSFYMAEGHSAAHFIRRIRQ